MAGGTSSTVSVVIPCYNQRKFLSDAIESVLGQTLQPLEIIIVDDGSTDESAAVASRYPDIHYIHQSNQGPSAARNTGWRASQGDFLVFLDADDRLLPRHLEVGGRALQAFPGVGLVYGGSPS